MGTTLSPLCAFLLPEVPDSSGPTSSATGWSSIPRTTSSPMTCSPMPATDPTWPMSRTGSSSSKGTSATAPWPKRPSETQGIDTIVNFAAESHNSLAVLNPGLFFRTNVIGTQTLLEAARQVGVDRFHHISTCEVYGDLALDTDEVFTEDSPYRPRTPYNASKAGSDHAVRAYGETYELPVTITNCSNNYGPYQFPEKVIPVFTTSALDDKNLTLYATTENRREWLHVRDHCTAIEAVLAAGQGRRDLPRGQRRGGLHHGDRRPGAQDAGQARLAQGDRARSPRPRPSLPARLLQAAHPARLGAPDLLGGRPGRDGRVVRRQPVWWEPLRARAPVVEGGWGAAG